VSRTSPPRPWLTHPFDSARNALTAGLWCGVISDLTTYYAHAASVADYFSPSGRRNLVVCVGVATTIALVVALILSAVRRQRLKWG
jgi:hypothetical protein